MAAIWLLVAVGAIAQGTWTPTGRLDVARRDHATALLADGKVLVVGGTAGSTAAELYDPGTGTFAATGATSVAHGSGLSATRLTDGQVLVAGGLNAPGAAELYDPAAGAFTSTGALIVARRAHTATRLADGRVLIAGGFDPAGRPIDAAELYDPPTGTFTPTGSLAARRAGATAVLLPDGRVLVAGGRGGGAGGPAAPECLNSAEIYDPATGTFSITVTMTASRCVLWWSDAPVLASGKVLIAGGLTASSAAGLRSAELFDPATMTFSPTGSMSSAHGNHTATLLSDGRVLIAGGRNDDGTVMSSAELYDPATGTFAAAAGMAVAREQHAATLLSTGAVLVTGGFNFAAMDLDSAELFAESERRDVLIDFERRSDPPAEPWADAIEIYRALGVTFPSHPTILPNAALSSGFQSLIQTDPRGPRPERRCGPLEIALAPELRAGRISFEARNVGFIGIPVQITVTGRDAGGTVVARVTRVSESRLGRLQPVEMIDLEAGAAAADLVRVTVEYGSCPPQVVIDNLLVSAR